MNIKTLFCIILLQFNIAGNAQFFQENEPKKVSLEERVKLLENELNFKNMLHQNELNNLKGQVSSYAPMGMLLFLFGGVCALWAQSTGRSAWAWFFAGLFLSVLALIMVLAIHSDDIKKSDN